MFGTMKSRMPDPASALPGRAEPQALLNRHFVHGRPLRGAFPGCAQLGLGMGCFWGAERLYWSLPGVVTTAVGYAGGYTPNPSYREVCSGHTGHNEVVWLVFDPALVALDALLLRFWENHDPTQGMRQGNDVGTQYRSGIYCTTPTQHAAALASRDAYGLRLRDARRGAITTEIAYPAPPFYYAEDYHQQYLAKNPDGYCGIGGCGVPYAPAPPGPEHAGPGAHAAAGKTRGSLPE